MPDLYQTKIGLLMLYERVICTSKRIWTGTKLVFTGITDFANVSRGLGIIKEGVKHLFNNTDGQRKARIIEAAITHITDDNERIIYKTILATHLNADKSYFSSNESKYASVITTSLVVKVLDRLNVGNFIGVQPMTAPAVLVYYLEWLEGPKLEITTIPTNATTRQLSCRPTIAACRDDELVVPGTTLAEYENIIATVIANDIDQAIINAIVDVSQPVIYDGTDLALTIIKLSNQIAINTQRSFGNFVIMSRDAFSQLNSLQFVPNSTEDNKVSYITLVGSLAGNIKVYISEFMPTNADGVVGFRGTSSIDVGMVFSPYHLVIPSGVVINPRTFEPTVQLLTRYGLSKQEKASAYYMSFNLNKQV